MSTLNVDKVDPSTGTTLELGTSGDTINIPSGVTIANSGTATGFGIADLVDDTSPQLGGDLDVVTYDIVSTSNRDIDIAPHGTGDVVLKADTVTVGDAAAAATLRSSGAGTLTITTGGTENLILSTNNGTDSGNITITDGANEDIVITPNGTGDTKLEVGNLRISTGKGIDFDSSGTSAILDDYEEGTWTPALNYAGDATGVTHAQQNGNYTKIGNRVYYRGTIKLSAKGSGTGHARLSGLPETGVNVGWDEQACSMMFDDTVDAWGMAGLVSTTHLALHYYPDAGTGAAPAYKGQFTDDLLLMVNGNYQVA